MPLADLLVPWGLRGRKMVDWLCACDPSARMIPRKNAASCHRCRLHLSDRCDRSFLLRYVGALLPFGKECAGFAHY